MGKKPQKVIFVILCVVLIAALLTGCYVPFYRGPQFTEEEEAELLTKGQEIMTRFLPEEAYITSIEPSFAILQKLPDVVKGEYVYEGKSYWFTVNVITEEIETEELVEAVMPDAIGDVELIITNEQETESMP